MIEIDGSKGEGGGQILRSSLSLALITGKSVRLTNLRAGRDKPGLMRQHLTALRAATEVGNAEVEGDEVGSQTVTFKPGPIQSGTYTFSVGTAGSSTLVLQTVLPALMVAQGPSDITLEGGTHNQWAPPYDFLTQVYFPLLHRMGVDTTSALERYGFYPAGGGRFSVSIRPPLNEFQGLRLLERGEVRRRFATAVVANLPKNIADREIETVAKKLGWSAECLHATSVANSQGPGNIVTVELQCEHITELFTGFGRQNARAERVAHEAAQQALTYLAADVPVGKYLADQLLLPMGIAAWRDGVRSEFRTPSLTRHTVTHIEILRTFLDVPIEVIQEGGASVRICVG